MVYPIVKHVGWELRIAPSPKAAGGCFVGFLLPEAVNQRMAAKDAELHGRHGPATDLGLT